jgi:hypothetical protein
MGCGGAAGGGAAGAAALRAALTASAFCTRSQGCDECGQFDHLLGTPPLYCLPVGPGLHHLIT